MLAVPATPLCLGALLLDPPCPPPPNPPTEPPPGEPVAPPPPPAKYCTQEEQTPLPDPKPVTPPPAPPSPPGLGLFGVDCPAAKAPPPPA